MEPGVQTYPSHRRHRKSLPGSMRVGRSCQQPMVLLPHYHNPAERLVTRMRMATQSM